MHGYSIFIIFMSLGPQRFLGPSFLIIVEFRKDNTNELEMHRSLKVLGCSCLMINLDTAIELLMHAGKLSNRYSILRYATIKIIYLGLRSTIARI
jgi:hypothetical protein